MGWFCWDSQVGYLSAVILSRSYLCSPALHCPAVTQALSFPLFCFQVSPPHFFSCAYSYASLCCCFLFCTSQLYHLYEVSIAWTARTKHILLMAVLFLGAWGVLDKGQTFLVLLIVILQWSLHWLNRILPVKAGSCSGPLQFIRGNHLSSDSANFSDEKPYLMELYIKLKLSWKKSGKFCFSAF